MQLEQGRNSRGNNKKIMKKSIFPLVMATTGHLAEEEDFKQSLSQSCIAKQHAQTSTVLAQNGNNKENVCVVWEEEAGNTGPLDVKKMYYKQAPNGRFYALQLWVLKWSLGRNMGVRMLDSLCLALHSRPGKHCLVPAPSFTHRSASFCLPTEKGSSYG